MLNARDAQVLDPIVEGESDLQVSLQISQRCCADVQAAKSLSCMMRILELKALRVQYEG